MIWCIVIYVATVIIVWILYAVDLKKKKKVVKIKDVAEAVDWGVYLPVVNTAVLACAIIIGFIWEGCKLRVVWDKVKDIEL